MKVARIDDKSYSADDFVKYLKLDQRFDDLAEKFMTNRLIVRAAEKRGISVSDQEVQERFDQLRRVQGLHRAKDTLEYLENLGITPEEMQAHLRDEMMSEKMLTEVVTEDAVNEYFRLHSPKFERVELCLISVESEQKAKELISMLEDDPDEFADLAREHSLDLDSAAKGGSIGVHSRGVLNPVIEAKLFSAEPGQPVGPFSTGARLSFEIYMVKEKIPAKLDADTQAKVAEIVRDEWLNERSQEHVLEVL